MSPYSSQACSESLTPDAISAKSTETALLATGTDHPVYGSQDRAFASRATPSNDTQQPQPKKLSRGQRRRKQEENRIQLIQDQKILQHQHKAKIQISRQKLRDPYLSPTGTGRTTGMIRASTWFKKLLCLKGYVPTNFSPWYMQPMPLF